MTRLLSILFSTVVTIACSESSGLNTETIVLNVVSGNQQIGLQRTILSEPLVVAATYESGEPVIGATFSISVTDGGGMVLNADSVSDATGLLQFEWQLGDGYLNAIRVSPRDNAADYVICTASARYLYATPEETGDGWETASLTAVGMNVEPITTMMNAIRSGSYSEVHSVVIVKDNRLVLEEYFSGHDFGYTGENFHGRFIQFDRDTRHNTHSATKSITSALVGIAIDQGQIANEDEKIFPYFPNHAALNVGAKDSITIRHLLTMTSGLEWNEWDVGVASGGNDVDLFNNAHDAVHYFLSKPLLHNPGRTFYYNGGGVDILGEIVARAVGTRVDVFARNNLFRPLGISNYIFQQLPNGLMACHGDIYMRPRDLAKFGFLYLNNGVWQGERILSEEWVRKSIAPSVSLADWQLTWADDYGYLWWLKDYSHDGNTYSSFKALGWGGQEIMIFPDSDMVVVFTGANYMQNPPCDELLMRYVLPALNE